MTTATRAPQTIEQHLREVEPADDWDTARVKAQPFHPDSLWAAALPCGALASALESFIAQEVK